jgi:hypothetical protein
MFGKSGIVVGVVNPNDIQHSFHRKSWDLWTIRWALAFNGLRHFTQDPDAVFWARETAFHGVTVSPTEHDPRLLPGGVRHLKKYNKMQGPKEKMPIKWEGIR